MSHQRKIEDQRKHVARLRVEENEAWTLANQTGKACDRMRAYEVMREAEEEANDLAAMEQEVAK